MGSEQPVHEHLGTSWEIAIVIVMVALLVAIVAATIFQIRRRRQKQRRALETDTENSNTPRRTTGAQEKTRRTGSVNTRDGIVEKHSHPVTFRDERRAEEIQMPSPSLKLKQANDSSYNEYLSKKPPNYYWEQRFH